MRNMTTITRLNPLIGLCDALTGVGLLLFPELVLSILGTTVAAESLVYIRYIGVFVFGVGLIYFVPYFVAANLDQRFDRILYSWTVTALIRLCVASFVVVELCLGGLGLHWLLVALTDATLAVVQVYFIKQSKR